MNILDEAECNKLWQELNVAESKIQEMKLIDKVYKMGYEQGVKDYDYYQESGVLII